MEPHTTRYSPFRSCFPLCEWCWPRLTVEERMPYYLKLFLVWEKNEIESGIPIGVTWPEIERAVTNEQATIH